MSDFELKLNYDKRNGREFRTLIISIMCLGMNCLIFSMDGNWVVLTMASPYAELRVPKSLIT
jgi:hypothetical protein